MKSIYLYIVGALIVFASCDPIEDRNSLAPAKTAEEINENIEITVDGNSVTCENPFGVTYWQASFGGMQNNGIEADFYIPKAGTHTITATVYAGDEPVVVDNQITITQEDAEYFSHEFWTKLTGGDTRTWVWADDIPGGKVWGNGGYRGNSAPGWWTLSMDDMIGRGMTLNDEMTFDLNSLGFNVTMENPEGFPGTGSGFFLIGTDTEDITPTADESATWGYGKLKLTNHTIFEGMQPNHGGAAIYEFDILKLTDDELVLAAPEPGSGPWGTAWFWMFKRKGYTYE